LLRLKLNLELLWHPVVEDYSLKTDGEIARVRNEAFTVCDIGLGVTTWTSKIFDY